MKFTKSVEIAAPAEQVWEVLAHDFENIGSWSSAVMSSAPNTAASVPDGADVGGRVCSTTLGDFKETFVSFSESDMSYAFEVEGMPSFVTLARNTTKVEPVGRDRSRVTLSIEMQTNAVGKVMGPAFAIKLKSTLSTLLDEMQDYVESGELSSRKRRQLAKAA